MVQVFGYDYIGDENTTQEEVWVSVGKPIVEACLTGMRLNETISKFNIIFLGYNGTIFAYGQTGSGKTFTVQV